MRDSFMLTQFWRCENEIDIPFWNVKVNELELLERPKTIAALRGLIHSLKSLHDEGKDVQT